jgi:hypothetical protein
MAMCDCQRFIAGQLQSKGYENPQNMNLELLSGRTFSQWEIVAAGRKRQVPVLHSFCPHCGKPYIKPEAEEIESREGQGDGRQDS